MSFDLPESDEGDRRAPSPIDQTEPPPPPTPSSPLTRANLEQHTKTAAVARNEQTASPPLDLDAPFDVAAAGGGAAASVPLPAAAAAGAGAAQANRRAAAAPAGDQHLPSALLDRGDQVVERYVLTEMGAVADLDEAVDKARAILEGSLYNCARQSLFHIAKNREDLQRERRDVETEKLRQDFEAKKLQAREEALNRREGLLIQREELMFDREEKLASRDRALERVQVFANEELRRQRLLSMANVEMSHIVLEHLRRLELGCSSGPQQIFLAHVARHLAAQEENLEIVKQQQQLASGASPGSGAGVGGGGSGSSPHHHHAAAHRGHHPRMKYEEQEEADEQQRHRPSAEELVVAAFHPMPPAASGNQSGHFSLRSHLLQQRASQLPPPFFLHIDAAPSFFYKMQRDFGLDVCPLHIRGTRALHVVREVPLSEFPLAAGAAAAAAGGTPLQTPSLQSRRHFKFNVIAGAGGASAAAANTNPMMLVPTHTTVGEAVFDIELFPPKLLRSFVLLGGEIAVEAMQLSMIGGSPNSSAGGNSPRAGLRGNSPISGAEEAFRSPVISFTYFAPKENGVRLAREKPRKEQRQQQQQQQEAKEQNNEDENQKEEKTEPEILEFPDFGDSLVLIVGAVVTEQPTQQQQQRLQIAGGGGGGGGGGTTSRPTSAASSRAANQQRPGSAALTASSRNPQQQQQQQQGRQTITVQHVVARVPLADFRAPTMFSPSGSLMENSSSSAAAAAADHENQTTVESTRSPPINFTAFVDLASKNLTVNRVNPKRTFTPHYNNNNSSANSLIEQAASPEAATAVGNAVLASGQADMLTFDAGDDSPNSQQQNGSSLSAARLPLQSSVVSFEEQWASHAVRSTLISSSGGGGGGHHLSGESGLYLGLMITSPCGAVEFVKVQEYAEFALATRQKQNQERLQAERHEQLAASSIMAMSLRRRMGASDTGAALASVGAAAQKLLMPMSQRRTAAGAAAAGGGAAATAGGDLPVLEESLPIPTLAPTPVGQ